MEVEVDEFLKFLQKKQKKLVKKLDRIKKKQVEVKSLNKEIKSEEKKLIESAPQTEELIQETEKMIQQYQKHLETKPKEVKKAAIKPDENRISEIIQLWTVGEFLKNPEIKEKFLKDYPNDSDVEPFLLFHSNIYDKAGEKFSDISSNFLKSVELFLGKSDSNVPGKLKSYNKLVEFSQKAFAWGGNKRKPDISIKKELNVDYGPTILTQKQEKPEKNEVVEVEKVNKQIAEEKINKPVVVEEVKTEYNPPAQNFKSSWNDVEDDEEDKAVAVGKGEVKQNEDDGFIVVTNKKPKGTKEKNTREHDGEFRSRGRGRGNRRGRGKPRENAEQNVREN